MTDLPIREPDQIRQDAARKLRQVQASSHFRAILGCLLGKDWTTPSLHEMMITIDGQLLGRKRGATRVFDFPRCGRGFDSEHPRRCPSGRTRWR